MKLEDFCAGPSDVLERLRQPFRVGDFAVATDRVRLLAEPISDPEHPPPHLDDGLKGQVEPVVLGIFAAVEAGVFQPMPDIQIPHAHPCEPCRGSGQAKTETCPECKGKGEVEAWNDFSTYPDLECQTCEGSGGIYQPGPGGRCRECGGDGRAFKRGDVVGVLDVALNPKYAEQLLQMPDLEVKAAPDRLIFRSGKRLGAIMGIDVCERT